jgi:RNA polymerase sigma factor (sigma-70 family)
MHSSESVSRGVDFTFSVRGLNEDVLVGAAQSGEEWAFVELCNRHSKRVFNMIYRVTKNCEDAEDALQDCLMKAFLHIDQFDGRSSFSTWLTRIGINSGLMILRKKRSCKEVPMESTFDGGETWQHYDIVDSSPDPEQDFASRQGSLQLRDAIHRLPGTLRSVIEIRQKDGASMREVAESMGISVPAAKSRLLRARSTLRTLTQGVQRI